MNAISLNILWSYLQGLTLTASTKRWLADRLYESARMEERPMTHEEKLAEAARIRKEKEKALWANIVCNCRLYYVKPQQDVVIDNQEPLRQLYKSVSRHAR